MKLVHYSKDEEFAPENRKPSGAAQSGCYFYPEGKEQQWTNRHRTTWTAPDDIPVIVENEFDAGEFGNETEVTELFISAEHLHLLQ